MKWLFLILAIVSEVTASLSLKAALEHPLWYLVVIVGYLLAFYFLTRVLREGLGLGVAYGIWGAAGVGLTAFLASLLFGEPLTPVMIVGMVFIIGGVLAIELGSQHAHRRREARQVN